LQHTIGKDCLLPMKFHIQSFLWPFWIIQAQNIKENIFAER
jgi:hypothetical protein